jgi:protein phosphatase PTC7
LERNLIPVEPGTAQEQVATQPVQVTSAGVAFPHPDKVRNEGAKAVNTRRRGHGGEDAYFHVTGK